MNLYKRNSGTFNSGTHTEIAPYTQTVQAVQQVIAAVREGQPVTMTAGAPASMIAVIIEETFQLLHQGALYSGMGEVAVTAAFASSVAAASEMWRRLWLWQGDEAQEQIIYQHYKDTEETVLGADFSLVFVDQTDNGPVYRVIVVQAKRLTAADPTKVNIWRKAFSPKQPETREAGGSGGRTGAATTASEGKTGDWEDAATERLERALAAGAPEKDDLDRAAENYQLTRLLNLSKLVQQTHAEFLYVMWPAKSSNGAANPVLFKELAKVAEYFRDTGQKTLLQKDNAEATKNRYPVSFTLGEHQNFRDYLLNYKDIPAMSEAELIEILPAIREESTATILLNASGRPLSPEVAKKLDITAKPPYEPATGTNSLTLTPK